jgi:hypothetical protein
LEGGWVEELWGEEGMTEELGGRGNGRGVGRGKGKEVANDLVLMIIVTSIGMKQTSIT